MDPTNTQSTEDSGSRAWKWVQIISAAVLILSLVLAIIGSISNSRAISSVTIQVNNPNEEHRDKTILGIGQDDALPDYRLQIIDVEGEKHHFGTHVNTSAADPITWTLQESFPLQKAASIRIADEDGLGADILEEVQLGSMTFKAPRYSYEIDTTRSLKAGMMYFISTPPGLVLAIAFGVAIFLAIAPYIVV